MAALCKCNGNYCYWLLWDFSWKGQVSFHLKTWRNIFRVCVCVCARVCGVYCNHACVWIQVASSAPSWLSQPSGWFPHPRSWIAFLRTMSVTELPPHFLGIKSKGLGVCGWILFSFSFLLMIITFPISIWMCLKVIPWGINWALSMSWWIIKTKCSPLIS